VVGFRDDLDIGDFMAPFEKVLGKAAVAERHTADANAVENPLHLGGEAFCSSSKALATTGTQFSYDVNGYYRELGVYWRASKAELMRAYQEADGPNDPRLTYIFKQLLNKETRERYDATPLGQVFLDEYVEDMLKERAIREAARRTREGEAYVSPEDVLAQWGFDLQESDVAADLIEGGEADDQDRDALRSQDTASQVEYLGKWSYGFYLWRSTCMDSDRLERWQKLLVDALAEQDAVVRFAVGYCGRQPQPFTIGLVGGGRYVVYLNDQHDEDSEIASRAASGLLREINKSRQSDTSRQDKNMADAPTPTFGRGGEAAEQADEALHASRSKKFHKVPYLSLKDGESQWVRYITDSPQWMWVKQHTGAPTKNPPADYTGNWPEAMPATCRYDEAFGGYYQDCYICDAKLVNKWKKPCNAVIRLWAIAVLREEVIGTQEMADAGQIDPKKVGFLVGCRDVYREVPVLDADGKDTGETKQELALVLVNQANGNYFKGLQSAYGTYGTVCDRDFKVERKGESKDTEFYNISGDPTPNLAPGTEKWQRYLDAVEEQKIDLGAINADRASDDYFARFFDPDKTVQSKDSSGDSKAAPASQQQSAPSNELNPEQLKAMKERLSGKTPAAAAAPAPDFD